MHAPYKPIVEREGQPYVDEDIVVNVAETSCAAAVRKVFGRPSQRPIVVGFNRVPLIWKKGKRK